MEIRPQDFDGIYWRFFVPPAWRRVASMAWRRFKDAESALLVLRVRAVVRRARRQEQHIHARRVREPVRDRDRAALARQVGRLAEDLGHRSTGCDVIRMIGAGYPCGTTVDHFDLEGVFGTERLPLLG